MNSLFPLSACCDGGVEGELHPRHDGAGPRREAEKRTQSYHHQECQLGDVPANVD